VEPSTAFKTQMLKKHGECNNPLPESCVRYAYVHGRKSLTNLLLPHTVRVGVYFTSSCQRSGAEVCRSNIGHPPFLFGVWRYRAQDRVGWKELGGYEGYGNHLREAVAAFDHVKLHPDIWQRNRPASSTPAHVFLKSVQHVDNRRGETVLHELRSAFFERCLDISSWSVLTGYFGGRRCVCR
jgi:hypothetical protein